MTAIGLVVHAGRPEALEAARAVVAWAKEHGVATRSLEVSEVGADETVDPSSFVGSLDLVVSVGGDGTLLRAAHEGYRAGGVPVLGVKVGRLGFLTEADPSEAADALDAWLAGDLEVEERMALVAEADGGGWSEPQWALNEVIVEKRARHRVIRLAAWVGEEYVTTFSADGVIVATPTGSTAYSFSARGPIVSPRLPCLVLTPVSPHMVFDRAVVLSPQEQVTLEVRGDEPGLISADGRPGVELPVGTRVRIRMAERPARLLRRKRAESFYARLRWKFQLPGDPTEHG